MRVLYKLSEFMLWHLVLSRHEYDGIPVRTWIDPNDHEIEAVAAALDLIKGLDPRTYRQIERLLLGGIAVAPSRVNPGWYDGRRKACFLSKNHVADYGREDVALTIVHETCHARLMHCGIGYEEELRYRVERACIRRELAFARLMQARDPIALSHDTYSAAAFRQIARKNRLLNLRPLKEIGASQCIRRFLVRRVRRQRQRAQQERR